MTKKKAKLFKQAGKAMIKSGILGTPGIGKKDVRLCKIGKYDIKGLPFVKSNIEMLQALLKEQHERGLNTAKQVAKCSDDYLKYDNLAKKATAEYIRALEMYEEIRLDMERTKDDLFKEILKAK